MSRFIFVLLLGLLLLGLVSADVIIRKDPVPLNNSVVRSRDGCVYERQVVERVEDVFDNVTFMENRSVVSLMVYNYTRFWNETVYVKNCEPVINVGVGRIDYSLQGFECSPARSGWFVCDSVRDGDGDGVCESGESCCNVNSESGVIFCNNGDSERLPVKRLVAR